jgi:hypothetical protein
MCTATFVEDNGILWLQLAKSGNPPAWQSGAIYNLGDIIVPSNPTQAQANMMFQCVGFLVPSGSTQPVWPSSPSAGAVFATDTTEYVARDTNANPVQLAANEYYVIDRTITVS